MRKLPAAFWRNLMILRRKNKTYCSEIQSRSYCWMFWDLFCHHHTGKVFMKASFYCKNRNKTHKGLQSCIIFYQPHVCVGCCQWRRHTYIHCSHLSSINARYELVPASEMEDLLLFMSRKCSWTHHGCYGIRIKRTKKNLKVAQCSCWSLLVVKASVVVNHSSFNKHKWQILIRSSEDLLLSMRRKCSWRHRGWRTIIETWRFTELHTFFIAWMFVQGVVGGENIDTDSLKLWFAASISGKCSWRHHYGIRIKDTKKLEGLQSCISVRWQHVLVGLLLLFVVKALVVGHQSGKNVELDLPLFLFYDTVSWISSGFWSKLVFFFW